EAGARAGPARPGDRAGGRARGARVPGDPRELRRILADAAVTARPAFSDAFAAEQLRHLEPLLPLEDVTPDWAWGGTTGKGVKVAVVDSGVESDHPQIGGRVAGYAAFDV